MLDFFLKSVFSHTTTFLGTSQVVLLGLFNAQGLGKDYQVQLRCRRGELSSKLAQFSCKIDTHDESDVVWCIGSGLHGGL